MKTETTQSASGTLAKSFPQGLLTKVSTCILHIIIIITYAALQCSP